MKASLVVQGSSSQCNDAMESAPEEQHLWLPGYVRISVDLFYGGQQTYLLHYSTNFRTYEYQHRFNL